MAGAQEFKPHPFPVKAQAQTLPGQLAVKLVGLPEQDGSDRTACGRGGRRHKSGFRPRAPRWANPGPSATLARLVWRPEARPVGSDPRRPGGCELGSGSGSRLAANSRPRSAQAGDRAPGRPPPEHRRPPATAPRPGADRAVAGRAGPKRCGHKGGTDNAASGTSPRPSVAGSAGRSRADAAAPRSRAGNSAAPRGNCPHVVAHPSDSRIAAGGSSQNTAVNHRPPHPTTVNHLSPRNNLARYSPANCRAKVVLPHWRGPNKAVTGLLFSPASTRATSSGRAINIRMWRIGCSPSAFQHKLNTQNQTAHGFTDGPRTKDQPSGRQPNITWPAYHLCEHSVPIREQTKWATPSSARLRKPPHPLRFVSTFSDVCRCVCQILATPQPDHSQSAVHSSPASAGASIPGGQSPCPTLARP